MWYKSKEAAKAAYDYYLDRAVERYIECAFYTKSAKKECLDDIRRAYEALIEYSKADTGRLYYDQQEKVLAELEAAAEKKYGVGCCYYQVHSDFMRRTEIGCKAFDKMMREWSFPDLHNLKVRHIPLLDLFEMKDPAFSLLELRNEVKEAPVFPKPKRENLEKKMITGLFERKYADRPFYEAAIAIYRDMEPEEVLGFRTQHSVTVQFHSVVNYAGTHFNRAMYFLNGKREALDVCMSYMNADFDFWLTHGKPDLSKWDNIYAFYRGE